MERALTDADGDAAGRDHGDAEHEQQDGAEASGPLLADRRHDRSEQERRAEDDEDDDRGVLRDGEQDPREPDDDDAATEEREERVLERPEHLIAERLVVLGVRPRRGRTTPAPSTRSSTAASRKMPARKTKRSVTSPMAVIDSANPPTSGHPLGETGFSLPYSPSASAAELAPTEAGTEASR